MDANVNWNRWERIWKTIVEDGSNRAQYPFFFLTIKNYIFHGPAILNRKSKLNKILEIVCNVLIETIQL